MQESDNIFVPEQVDEQIAQFSSPQAFPAQESTPEQRLIQDLDGIYGAGQETAQAIEHVWQRLEGSHGNLMTHHSSTKKTLIDSDRDLLHQERISSMEKRQKRPLWQVVGTLVAVLLVVILVGSMIIVTQVARQTHQTTVGHQNTTPGTSTPGQTQAQYLYAAAGTNLYKLDLQSGKIQWQYHTGDDLNTHNIDSTPAIIGNTVYIVDQSGTLYAINTDNGKVRWTLQVPGSAELGTPLVSGNSIYVVATPGTTFGAAPTGPQSTCAIDATTGKLQQCYPDFAARQVSQGILYGLNGTYVTTGDSPLIAFDPAKNTQIWQAPVPIAGQRFGFDNITVSNGVVYTTSDAAYEKSDPSFVPATRGSYVYAFTAQSGVLLWHSAQAAGDLILSPPAVADGRVYYGSQDGQGYAISATTGQPLWTLPASTCPSSNGVCPIYPTPAVSNGVVYMGVTSNGSGPAEDSYLIALNGAHGTQIWKHQLNGYMGEQLLLFNGSIYTGTSDGKIHALRADTGSEIWQSSVHSDPGTFIGSSISAFTIAS